MVKVGMCLFVCTSRFAERDLLKNAHPMKDLTFFICLFVWLFIAFGLVSPRAFICRKRKGITKYKYFYIEYLRPYFFLHSMNLCWAIGYVSILHC